MGGALRSEPVGGAGRIGVDSLGALGPPGIETPGGVAEDGTLVPPGWDTGGTASGAAVPLLAGDDEAVDDSSLCGLASRWGGEALDVGVELSGESASRFGSEFRGVGFALTGCVYEGDGVGADGL